MQTRESEREQGREASKSVHTESCEHTEDHFEDYLVQLTSCIRWWAGVPCTPWYGNERCPSVNLARAGGYPGCVRASELLHQPYAQG